MEATVNVTCYKSKVLKKTEDGEAITPAEGAEYRYVELLNGEVLSVRVY